MADVILFSSINSLKVNSISLLEKYVAPLIGFENNNSGAKLSFGPPGGCLTAAQLTQNQSGIPMIINMEDFLKKEYNRNSIYLNSSDIIMTLNIMESPDIITYVFLSLHLQKQS